MKHQDFFGKLILVSMFSVMPSVVYSNTQQFQPSTEPIFSTQQAKPNIHMILDDSGSMNSNSDISLTRNGSKVRRSAALSDTVEKLLYKYRDKAYLGISFLYQRSDQNGLIRLPIGDFHLLSEKDFKTTVVNPIKQLIANSPGHTPMHAGVYEAFKMFRGYPVNQAGGPWQRHHMIDLQPSPTGKGNQRYFPAVQLATPLRYRCQTNHMILMTDGEPYGEDVWGIPKEDAQALGASNAFLGYNTKSNMYHGVEQTFGAVFNAQNKDGHSSALGHLIATTDLSRAQKYVKKNHQWITKDLDDADEPWFDPNNPIPMKLTLHSVSLFVKPDHNIYKWLTQPSGGYNLGIAKNSNGSAEDLLLAFDTIFSSIIQSTSSSKAILDRIHADILYGAPKTNDLSTIGTIRYDTTYSFRQRFGTVRAMVPYISEWQTDPQDKTKRIPTQTNTLELWNTNDTITAKQGRYITHHQVLNQSAIYELNQRYRAAYPNSKNSFDQHYIAWLTDFTKPNHQHNLRSRLKPMGSITNSDIKLANKDILNINTASNAMSHTLAAELRQWLMYKAAHQPVNLLIVADNDGFINFINAHRGRKNGALAGARNTAYFPKILIPRIDEIAKSDKFASLILEGKTNLTDAKIGTNQYMTLGMTGMGSGGKGLVGYRIFSATGSPITASKQLKFTTNASSHEVTPLFEITNEGPQQYRTPGFENLGYTYSGFEFFNEDIQQNGQNSHRSVAVFGNGFGTQSSILYFIDAHTGQKLHEIVLDPMGGGAATPAIVITKSELGQRIDRIYVGDYSGSLYKVDFKGQNFDDAQAIVTKLFTVPQHPGHIGQSAISIKPLVLKDAKQYTIYFGTGLAVSHQHDRGENSQVNHNFYALDDRPTDAKQNSQATVSALKNAAIYHLQPQIMLEDLKKGSVEYVDKNKVNYLLDELHELKSITPINTALGDSKVKGWYIALSADHTNDYISGERIIHPPTFDINNQSVIISTWGIFEQKQQATATGSDDPCRADAAIGKSLAFNMKDGSAAHKIGLTHKGRTNNASSNLTGDNLIKSPLGNEMTQVSDFSSSEITELKSITHELSSSYTTDDNNFGVYCEGNLKGGLHCELLDRSKLSNIPIHKMRVSIQKIMNF